MENNNETAKEFAERINKLHEGKVHIMPKNAELTHHTCCQSPNVDNTKLQPQGEKQTISSIQHFEYLIEQNYEAVVLRGLITPDTDFYDFMDKLEEETAELAYEYNKKEGVIHKTDIEFTAELIDCISVLLNMAKHYKVDVIEGLKANIGKNFERAKTKNDEKEQK